jgi:hypothetical protein
VGFETQWFFAMIFITAEGFVLASPKRTPGRVLAAAIFAGAAGFSSGAGLLALPLGLGILLLGGPRRHALLWLAAAAVCCALYLHHYQRNPTPPLTRERILGIPRFVVTYLGCELVSGEDRVGLAGLAGALKLALFAGTLSACVRKRESLATLTPWLILAGYAIGCGALIAISWRGAPLSNALAARYATNSGLLRGDDRPRRPRARRIPEARAAEGSAIRARRCLPARAVPRRQRRLLAAPELRRQPVARRVRDALHRAWRPLLRCLPALEDPHCAPDPSARRRPGSPPSTVSRARATTVRSIPAGWSRRSASRMVGASRPG